MAISIDTSPANAISDLNDLIVEVRDEMDDDAFAVDKIYRAITRAEAMFNRKLRCPKMETEYQLAVTSEQTELPVDFLQLRAVYAEGSPDNPLDSLSPAGLRQRYQGVAGTPKAYAIENRRLIVGPVGDATATLVYYARIPSLTEANPSNWLLDENPDLYLHQVLAILFNKIGDSERAAANATYAAELLASINDSGKKNRWGAGPLVPRGIQQVWGARV